MPPLLGKKKAEFDRRTLRLSNYLDFAILPPRPPGLNLYEKVGTFTALGNEEHSNCVVVGAAHAIQTWSANAGREVCPTENQVLKAYYRLTGGADDGLIVLDFLKFWRKNPLWGHPLGGFVALNPRSRKQLEYALYLFGGMLIGFGLPEYIQGAATWDIKRPGDEGDDDPWSWGGHLTHCGVYRQTGGVMISTWDLEMPTSRPFVDKYADECYALLSLDWFTKDHKTPTGFAWADLKADLIRITRDTQVIQ